MEEKAVLFKLQKGKIAKALKDAMAAQKVKIVVRDADSSNESEARPVESLEWNKVIGLMVGGNFMTVSVVTVPQNKVIAYIDYDLTEVFNTPGEFLPFNETAKTDGSTGDNVCKLLASTCYMPGLKLAESKEPMGIVTPAEEFSDFSD